MKESDKEWTWLVIVQRAREMVHGGIFGYSRRYSTHIEAVGVRAAVVEVDVEATLLVGPCPLHLERSDTIQRGGQVSGRQKEIFTVLEGPARALHESWRSEVQK